MQFALFGLISNLVYLIYPAGIMWYRLSFFSYRVIQTLLFHALMTCSCLCTLLFDEIDINSNLWKKELLVICFMSVWACLGSTLYAGYPQTLNWFFVKQDPFYLIPASIAPFIMPIINPLLFFISETSYREFPPLLLNLKTTAPSQKSNSAGTTVSLKDCI